MQLLPMASSPDGQIRPPSARQLGHCLSVADALSLRDAVNQAAHSAAPLPTHPPRRSDRHARVSRTLGRMLAVWHATPRPSPLPAPASGPMRFERDHGPGEDQREVQPKAQNSLEREGAHDEQPLH